MKMAGTAENVIKQVLFKKGMDYEYVCKNLGITLGDFIDCMKGKRKLNAAEFLAICIFLNLSLDDFRECVKCY